MAVFHSRIPGFRRLGIAERLRAIAKLRGLDWRTLGAVLASGGIDLETADSMVENALGLIAVPFGVALNFRINGRYVLVPMAVEEPSVVAAVSLAAKIARAGGGFTAECDPSLMIAQVQITHYGDAASAKEKLLAHKEQLLALANSFHPQMVRRGGGAVDIEVRVLPAPEGPKGEPILVLHVVLDTQDAMGANLVNTVAEGVAPMVEQITGGRVYLRILSNLADRRLARATCRIPVEALADFGMDGQTVAEGIVQASRFAEADPYRACTHNKGVMNGVDAVAIATGNDWRAIEAGAHAYAARNGRYEPLSTWRIEDGNLVGRIELPLAVGTVGGPIRIHPSVRLAYKVLATCWAAQRAGGKGPPEVPPTDAARAAGAALTDLIAAARDGASPAGMDRGSGFLQTEMADLAAALVPDAA